jgi:hypothetical protein
MIHLSLRDGKTLTATYEWFGGLFKRLQGLSNITSLFLTVIPAAKIELFSQWLGLAGLRLMSPTEPRRQLPIIRQLQQSTSKLLPSQLLMFKAQGRTIPNGVLSAQTAQ